MFALQVDGETPDAALAAFHKFMFEGYRCFQNRDEEGLKQSVEQAMRCAAGDPALKAAEACSSVYPAVGRLSAALVLGDVWNLTSPSSAEGILKRWRELVRLLNVAQINRTYAIRHCLFIVRRK